MVKIHPLAIVDEKAELAEDVEIGPYCTVGPNVKIGAGTKLMSHVVIDGYTTLGQRNTVYPFTTLGLLAQHKRSNAPDAVLEIGDDNLFREHVTAHVGSEVDNKITKIGSRNWFLVGSHIAHDCVVGNDVIMSNNATLAGHVHVQDRAIIGGLSAVQQFTRIGTGAMIGGMCGVKRDVIPFGIIMGGYDSPLNGLNLIGLQRAGFEKADIFDLQKAYKELFDKEGGSFAERIERIANNAEQMKNPLIATVIRFVQNPSKNNILQPE